MKKIENSRPESIETRLSLVRDYLHKMYAYSRLDTEPDTLSFIDRTNESENIFGFHYVRGFRGSLAFSSTIPFVAYFLLTVGLFFFFDLWLIKIAVAFVGLMFLLMLGMDLKAFIDKAPISDISFMVNIDKKCIQFVHAGFGDVLSEEMIFFSDTVKFAKGESDYCYIYVNDKAINTQGLVFVKMPDAIFDAIEYMLMMLTENYGGASDDKETELCRSGQIESENDNDVTGDIADAPDEIHSDLHHREAKLVNSGLRVVKRGAYDSDDESDEDYSQNRTAHDADSGVSVARTKAAVSDSSLNTTTTANLSDKLCDAADNLSELTKEEKQAESDSIMPEIDELSAVQDVDSAAFSWISADKKSEFSSTEHESGGTRASRYRDLVKICDTDSGTLFRAADTCGHPVFIKILDSGSLISWKAKDYFKREAEVLDGMQGEGIPKFIDSFEENSKSYLVTSYTAAPTLAERMKSGKCADYAQAVQMLRHLAEILIRLSENAIVHRNINPGNVRVDDDMNVMLFDFGKSVPLNTGFGGMDFMSDPTKYTAPEVSYGKASAASDIYSAGLTVLSWLTAKRAEDMTVDFMNIDVKAEIPADLPEWFGKLIIGMTESEEQRRIQHAAQIIECIEENCP